MAIKSKRRLPALNPGMKRVEAEGCCKKKRVISTAQSGSMPPKDFTRRPETASR